MDGIINLALMAKKILNSTKEEVEAFDTIRDSTIKLIQANCT